MAHSIPNREQLRDEYYIDRDIVFLNHGSFGAVPRLVYENRLSWLARIEQNPMRFYAHEYATLLRDSRVALAEYMACSPEDITYVRNSTHGVNIAARSVHLEAGDEILSTSLEYGACDLLWEHIAAETGATYRRVEIPLPLPEPEEIEQLIIKGITPKTKVIFVSHITSSTAAYIPIEQICHVAQIRGITTIIDASHSPSHIPVQLQSLGADFYTANNHKWLCAPRSSGFLYCSPRVQPSVLPPVISWGWSTEGETDFFNSENSFIERLIWQGTDDVTSYLATPSAIQFQEERSWEDVRESNKELLHASYEKLLSITGVSSIYANELPPCRQMGTLILPEGTNCKLLQSRLWNEYRIEVMVQQWKNLPLLRISVQGYNLPEEYEILYNALSTIYLT